MYFSLALVPFTKTKFVGLFMSFRPTRKAFLVIWVVQSMYLDLASNKNALSTGPQQQSLWQQMGILSILVSFDNLASFFCNSCSCSLLRFRLELSSSFCGTEGKWMPYWSMFGMKLKKKKSSTNTADTRRWYTALCIFWAKKEVVRTACNSCLFFVDETKRPFVLSLHKRSRKILRCCAPYFKSKSWDKKYTELSAAAGYFLPKKVKNWPVEIQSVGYRRL